MCYRKLNDLFTDLEFLMKFILFWVVALTTIPMPESYIPLPEGQNIHECLYGLYGATVNGTLIMCATMMIVLGLGEDIKSVANIMLPVYGVLNFSCGVLFSCYAHSSDESSNIIIMIPIFFFIYFCIILIDILLSYFYLNYKIIEEKVWE